jgi:hypothetical protein
MINLQNIEHCHKVLMKEFNDNYNEYHGKEDKDFTDLCLTISRLRTIIKRMEKQNAKC